MVILGELGLIHQEVSAALETLVYGHGSMRVRLSRAMNEMLPDDLSLSCRVQRRPDLSQHQLDGRVAIVTHHGLINEARVDLIDSEDHRLSMVGVEREFAHAEAL